MGVFGSPDLEWLRADRRSIMVAFAARVAAPAAGVVVLWVVAVIAFGGGAVAAVAEGLAAIAVVMAVTRLFARRLAGELAELAAAARRMADEQKPQIVAQARDGQRASAPEWELPGKGSSAETARLTAAILRLRRTAIDSAVGEAALREGIGKVFVSLARRNQSLLQRQLRLIDALEQKASDPATLAELFRLDHMTTRMRRHAEGLIILSGAAPGRSWSRPVPIIDVIRAAVAEVEDYKRVAVQTRSQDAVLGSAAADLTHLLAELIENGTLFSPSQMRVEVRAEQVTNGFAIEIDDRGLGIQPSQLSVINDRLASPPDFDLANADQLGLFVVSRLAARHGVRVSLRPSAYGGTTAVVLLPAGLMRPASDIEEARSLPGPGPQPPGMELAPAVPGQSPVAVPWGASRLMGRAAEPDDAADPDPDPDPDPAEAAPAWRAFDEDDEAEVGHAPATYRGLPRRIRSAGRAGERPGGDPGGAGHAESPARIRDRSPEETRDLVATLQRGWQRGRDAGTGRVGERDEAASRAADAAESEEA